MCEIQRTGRRYEFSQWMDELLIDFSQYQSVSMTFQSPLNVQRNVSWHPLSNIKNHQYQMHDPLNPSDQTKDRKKPKKKKKKHRILKVMIIYRKTMELVNSASLFHSIIVQHLLLYPPNRTRIHHLPPNLPSLPCVHLPIPNLQLPTLVQH